MTKKERVCLEAEETGELRQVMTEDGGSEVKMQSWAQWSNQLRTTEGAWVLEGHEEIVDLGKLVWHWCVE